MKQLLTAIAVTALIGTPAFAADMAVKAPPPAPAPVYNWTGFYAGLNAGGSWGKDNTTVNFPGPTFSEASVSAPNVGGLTVICIDPSGCPLSSPVAFQESTHANGVIAGGQVGYNWQTTSNWILGFEADFQGTGVKGSGNNQTERELFSFTSFPLFAALNTSQSISHEEKLLWFGTVRGRVGYAIWPTVMLYATGGLAYGRLNELVSASLNGFCTTNDISCTGSITFQNGPTRTVPFSVSQGFEAAVTKTGWTLGGGIEGVVPDTPITLKVEYLYMDLGTANYTFNNPLLGTILVSSHLTDNIVRVGANYQFH